MKQSENLFFELLQVAIGSRNRLSSTPTLEEWDDIQELCKKQTMVGIGFVGMKRLPQEQWPQDRRFIMRWTMRAEKIKTRNEKINTECIFLTKGLAKEELHSCILKGQSNLKYYNTLLESYRTSGDIDIWVWSDRGKVSDVIQYVLSRDDKATVYYHHSNGNIFRHVVKKTDTEIHHRPSWMSAPWRNKVFQRFCNEHKNDISKYPIEISEGKKAFFYVPSVEFDAVYQLVHIYRHLFNEGIGLRQMLDYYMVLINLTPSLSKGERKGCSQKEAMKVLSDLGMERFTSAVMWVLQEVFAMKAEYLLCEPKEKEGRFLLKEIMLAGNFGHEDERYTITREENVVRWGLMKLKRNMKFLTSYPEEVICEPLFRVFHWAWRTFKLWRF